MDSVIRENPLESGGDVVPLCVHSKHLAAPTFAELFSDLFDELSFLRLEPLFRKVLGFGNHEANVAFELRIKFRPVQGVQAIRVVRIEQ